MLRPSSVMRRVRRLSAAMLVAMTALFLSLGGVGYAAISIPSNSISNSMLKNNSVGFAKMRANAIGYQQIKPGSVGTVRIDKAEIQQAIKPGCTTAGQAITAIAENGTVTCGAALPAEFDSGVGTAAALASPTTPATVASFSLVGGSPYFVQADPTIAVTAGASDATADHVVVTCTLAAGTSTTATQTRSTSVDLPVGATGTYYAQVPLTVTAPTAANSETADVTCTRTVTTGDSPTVTGQATIYALQTASNTSAATPSKAG